MPSQQELINHGLPGALARGLGLDGPNTGLTATGSNQSGALLLTAAVSIFSTVAANTGALLPLASNKPPYLVVNSGANALTVYPNNATDVINNTTSVSIPAGKTATFYQYEGAPGVAPGWIANISA